MVAVPIMANEPGTAGKDFIMDLPWVKHYDPWFKAKINYPEQTMYEGLAASAKRWPDLTALEFMGSHISFRDLDAMVSQAAASLQEAGFKKGDVAAICLPNTPHAVIFFYAVNFLGGICNMIHPLTPAAELAHYIRTTRSSYLFILDAMLAQHTQMLDQAGLRQTVVCSITDFLKPVLKLGFYVTKGRKIKAVPDKPLYRKWRDFYKSAAAPAVYRRQGSPLGCSVYLHSGGTTGTPKTIMLSDHNFNILAIQGRQIVGFSLDDETYDPSDLAMVTILPLFHGFGLCMGMHTMILNGIRAILVPQFSAAVLAKIIVKQRPTFIAAVPTLFEGMLQNEKLQNADLSCLTAVFCGGDTLPRELKERFDNFIQKRGASCTLREGYGLTETVTVCTVNPSLDNRAGSVGLPLADVLMKAVETGTVNPLQTGQDGEFCIHAPTMMLGYLDDPEATAETIKLHEDGLLWVHTGDLGNMDEHGYFYFKQRIKRIIKVSGIPVFPSQIEDLVTAVPGVRLACAIGIPHPYKMQVVKVFLVPESNVTDLADLEERVLAHCKKNLIQYAVPQEIEIRQDLPRTKVGKIDFVSLERIELEKHRPAGKGQEDDKA